LRLHHPIGSLLLLWPCLWALWVASQGWPDTKILGIFILGTWVMRSCGCVINDIADRRFDGQVRRTRNRPLVMGEVRIIEAVGWVMLMGMLALILVLQLNKPTIQLATIGLILTLLYPFAKRVTYWPQLVLGIAFSWPIPMAYVAQTGKTSRVTWLLFLASIFWALAYDTIYAIIDREDDCKIGIKSTAVLLGEYECRFVVFFQTIMLGLLACAGWQLHLTWIYYFSLILAAALMAYQAYLISDRESARCLKAFRNNNWVGIVIFMGFFLSLG